MKIKKLFWLFFSLTFSPGIFAQQDSTDLSFQAVAFVPETFEDSLTYGSGDYALQLEFDVDDLENLGRVWIEVLSPGEGGIETTIYYVSYTINQLENLNLIEGSTIALNLGVVSTLNAFIVNVRIDDLQGHQKKSISKSLAQ